MGVDTDLQIKRILGVDAFNRLRQLGYEVERAEELRRLRQVDAAMRQIQIAANSTHQARRRDGEYE